MVNVLCKRTKSQLDAIDMVYRDKYNRTLREYVNKEMGSSLAQFLVYTQMKEEEFDCHIMEKAFKGIGCDSNLLVEMLTTRSWRRLQAAR